MHHVLLEGSERLWPFVMHSMVFEGPADQLEIVKPGTEALGTTYFATDGGFTNMSAAVGDAEVAYDLVTIHPTFTVADAPGTFGFPAKF